MAGVIVLAFVWRWVDASQPVDAPSLYSRMAASWGVAGMLAGVLLGAMSVVGDLFESLVKSAQPAPRTAATCCPATAGARPRRCAAAGVPDRHRPGYELSAP